MDFENVRLEGEEYNFRFIKVLNMEINVKSVGFNILVLGNLDCF